MFGSRKEAIGRTGVLGLKGAQIHQRKERADSNSKDLQYKGQSACLERGAENEQGSKGEGVGRGNARSSIREKTFFNALGNKGSFVGEGVGSQGKVCQVPPGPLPQSSRRNPRPISRRDGKEEGERIGGVHVFNLWKGSNFDLLSLDGSGEDGGKQL